MKEYVCEKHHIKDDGDEYVKLIIFERVDNVLEVTDITHHNSETLADEWLKAEWSISIPPKFGERLEFESDY